MGLLSETWDFVRELPDENLPQLHGGAVQVISTPATPELRAYTRALAERADLCRARKVDPKDDNLLKITSDGRQAALFNGPPSSIWPAHRVTKVDALAKNVWRHYCDSDARSGAQLVFIDLFTPKSNEGDEDYIIPKLTDEERWLQTGVYGVIKAKLVARGIAPDEIAFAHDYQTPKLRARLHSGIRSGAVRVCIGSTALIGLGVNVQDRGCALHHLDCPWRPDELEQRTKRFERQGNSFAVVLVYVYVTEGSYDPVVWQIVEGKARWQQQLYRGKVGRRSTEDVGAVVLTASLAKAVALGDTRVLEKVRLEGELALLEARWLSWSQGRGVLRRDVDRLPGEIATLEARAGRLKRYAEVVGHVVREQALAARSESGAGKGAELGLCILNSALGLSDSTHAPTQTPGHTWPTAMDEANTLLRSAWLRHGQRPSNMLVGTWRGFALWIEYRKLGSVLSAYPVGDAVDGDGLTVMGVSFQSSRPADGVAQLLDVQRLAQDARLCEQRALGLRQRLTVAERDLGEVWALQADVERQLLAYGRACEGREAVGVEGEVGYVAKLEPLRDAIVYRFKF